MNKEQTNTEVMDSTYTASNVEKAIALLREGMESTGTGTMHYKKMREAIDLLTTVHTEANLAKERP